MPITTLSYGYKKPSAPTAGDLWFPAMETNIQLMNDHTHNGTNAPFLAKDSQEASSGSWGSDLGGGTYRQLITMTNSRVYDSSNIEVRVTSTKNIVYPTIEKVSSNTFYIYTNDNSVGFTIYYV